MDKETVRLRTLANRAFITARQIAETHQFLARAIIDAPNDVTRAYPMEQTILDLCDAEARLRNLVEYLDRRTGVRTGGSDEPK